jgi:anti-sigma B factor antagonist
MRRQTRHRTVYFGGNLVDYKQLELKDRGEVVVAYLKPGSILDQKLIDQIGSELDAAAFEASGVRKLLINFQSVQYMSSAMLGKLVSLNKRCKTDKVKLKFCGISANVMEVFEITRLVKIFDIQKDESAALAAFG